MSAARFAAPDAARFAALRHPDLRAYLGGTLLAMMADNIEHVITYWKLWDTYHSAALSGFEIISHWTPFLLFSVWFGALADRFDCRRVIQVGQVLFMLVSAAWGVLFLTGTLTIPVACVLLVVHGVAGSLWAPAEQLMLHDIVEPAELPSAVRLNATARNLGILAGPVIGDALLLGLHDSWGILTNVLFYLPLTLWLLRTRFTGHLRAGGPRPRVSALAALRSLGAVRADPRLLSLIVLAGLSSLFVGVVLQSTIPAFADDLHLVSGGVGYGALLFANGLGGVVGGLVLEATGWVRPTVRAAFTGTLLFGAAALGFALSGSFWLSLVLLLAVGLGALLSMSVGMTVVQLLAPDERRGQVIGVYSMSANGLRTGSGVILGLTGTAWGVHGSLAVCATALCACTAALWAWTTRALRRGPATTLRT